MTDNKVTTGGGDAPSVAVAAFADSGASNATATTPQKHPLETPWSLWLRLPDAKGQQNWAESQICGHTFGSVEDFWCMFNSVRGPFEIGPCDYSIFREGITPAWEDKSFVGGGRIVISLGGGGGGSGRGGGGSRGNVEAFPPYYSEVWLHLILGLIGENFDEAGGSSIGGLRVNVKRNNVKLEVWIKKLDRPARELLSKALLNLVAGFLPDERDQRRNLKAQYSNFDDNQAEAFTLSYNPQQ